MSFTPLYHPKVAEEDLSELPVNIQRRIAQAIEVRLTMNPEHGPPLRRTLKGYRKLRVGDYRVVYKVVGTEIWIFGIRHRKHVYEDVPLRLNWHPG